MLEVMRRRAHETDCDGGGVRVGVAGAHSRGRSRVSGVERVGTAGVPASRRALSYSTISHTTRPRL